jgi:hypothetical protein
LIEMIKILCETSEFFKRFLSRFSQDAH